jgi:hypothetical protein
MSVGSRPRTRQLGVITGVSAALVVLTGLVGIPNATAADPAPTVTAVSPGSADYAAQPSITVTGTGFAAGDTVSLTNPGGDPQSMSDVTVTSATSLQFTAPVMEVNKYDVRVTGPSGKSAKTSADRLDFTRVVTGSAWQPSTLPTPSDYNPDVDNAELGRVSCSDIDDCVAIGEYKNTSGPWNMLDTSSAGSWTSVRAPEPADIGRKHHYGFNYGAGSVACGAVGHCVVLGHYRRAHLGHRSFAETLTSGTWQAVPAAVPNGDPADEQIILHAASCAGVDCVAVGDTSAGRAVISTLHAGIWKTSYAPTHPQTERSHLFSVSCATQTYCVAVGLARNSQNKVTPLVDTLENGSWSAGTLPLPANAHAQQVYSHHIQAVSCGAPGFCSAVGQYRTDAPESHSVLMTLEAGQWTPTETSISGFLGTQDNHVSQVSCASAGRCIAIDTRAFVVASYHDGSWSVARANVPPGEGTEEGTDWYGYIEGVGCISSHTCLAVGNYGTNYYGSTLVNTFSGSSSSAAAMPLPDPAVTAGDLGAVSCVADGCVAVGTYFYRGTWGIPLAETLPAS